MLKINMLVDEYTADVLEKLYKNHPTPIQLDAHDLADFYYADKEFLPSGNELLGKKQSVATAIDYLIEIGFITASSQDDGKYQNCLLTTKGLAAINETSESFYDVYSVSINKMTVAKKVRRIYGKIIKLTKRSIHNILLWYMSLGLTFYLIIIPICYFNGWIQISYVA